MNQDEEGRSSRESLRTPTNFEMDQDEEERTPANNDQSHLQESDSESVAAAAATAARIGDSSESESGDDGDDGEVFMGINQSLSSDDDEGGDSSGERVHTGRRTDAETSCFV